MKQPTQHQPVMFDETIEQLNVKQACWYIDATFGRGGHTSGILKKGGFVFALDWDQEAIAFAHTQFAAEIAQGTFIITRANFVQIEDLWRAEPTVNQMLPQGILFDFGTTSNQLLSADRGFSFDSDSPLDMRMDNRLGVTAADFLQVLSEKELASVFRTYGGESYAQPIAKKIKQASPVTTTRQLAELVSRAKPPFRGHLHPATKVFQALRIIVNSELENIELALPKAFKLLPSSGRLVTLAFHEGEDRLVKHYFKQLESKSLVRLITQKPLMPTQQEQEFNQRSRSTKLRVIEKL